MSILIDTARIAGFRGISELEISLSRISVLLGVNNSGKTSLLKALQLAAGDYSRHLAEEDFFIGPDNKRAKEILVDLRIVPVDTEGSRTDIFEDTWQVAFGDKIKAEATGHQYVALRTCSKLNQIKGGFETIRATLDKWPDRGNWQTESVKLTKLASRLAGLSFVAIEAQRDIFHELKDRASFVGRILSSVKYNEEDIGTLEALIQELNNDAVSKSADLTELKNHLENLHQTFEGSGIAEITPFPKKIRDLSKHFSIHYGEESTSSTFSMEYHGMGTRSWASMLTVKAFQNLSAERHEEEEEPFFPIIAAEEPESHLHPCAQKTLYQQLTNSKGQVIVSTHSPYLAAIARQQDLRYLKKSDSSICVHYLEPNLSEDVQRRLQREVIYYRGEILFAKALVLCEGETEEQALPLLFERYFGTSPFVLGITFIGVGGSGNKYLPFLYFAKSFAIPVFIFSDGEERTKTQLQKKYSEVFGNTDISSCPNIIILNNTDFEGYLIQSGFKTQIEQAIIALDGEDFIPHWIDQNDGQIERVRKPDTLCPKCNHPLYEKIPKDYRSSDGYNRALLQLLKKNKTRYASAVAEELCKLNPSQFPPKIIDLLTSIREGVGI